MTEIAQAYLHFRSANIGRAQFEEIKSVLVEEAVHKSDLYYGRRVAIEINAAEGSLKIWITVIGTIGTMIYGAHKFVVDYPSFRQGIVELCKDAESFGYKSCSAVRKLIDKESNEDVITQARKKTPGSIYRVMRQMEDFHKYSVPEGIERSSYIIDSLSNSIESVMLKLDDERDRKLLIDNLHSRFGNMGSVGFDAELLYKGPEHYLGILQDHRPGTLFYSNTIFATENENLQSRLTRDE